MAQEQQREELLIRDRVTGQSRPYYVDAKNINLGDDETYKSLPDVLDEMQDDIDDAKEHGGGSVTGVKVGDTTYEPTDGVVDLSTPFANKVDKETGKGLSTNDYTTEEKSKLGNLPTADQLTQQLGGKANDNAVVKSVTVNGTAQQKDTNGNVNVVVPSGGLTESDIRVETQGDGTVDINVGSDTYNINLNHTHENMAKLIVCEESDLPSTLDPATIYAITDSGETEIEKLIIRGMEFAGGGVPDTGEPMISSPSNGSTINLGDNTSGQGVSKTITIKGKNLTGDLTVAVGTGLTISYGQTLDGSSVTIPMAQALLGAQVTISYSGSGALDDGSLVISHGNDVLSSVVVVVVVAPVQVAGVKLTGTQWLETDYIVKSNTKISIRGTFASNSITEDTNRWYYLGAEPSNSSNLLLYVGKNDSSNYSFCCYTTTPTIKAIAKSTITTPNSTIEVYGSTLKFTPNGGSAVTATLSAAVVDLANPLYIGKGEGRIFGSFDWTIFEITISEGSEVKRHYIPATLQGVPGLYDTVTGAFISSMVEGEPLVVVQS